MSEIKKAKYLGGIGAVLIAVGVLLLGFFLIAASNLLSHNLLTWREGLFGLIVLISFVIGVICFFLGFKKITNIIGKKDPFWNLVVAFIITISSLITPIVGTALFLVAAIFFSKSLKEIGKITRQKLFHWAANVFLLSGVLSVILSSLGILYMICTLFGQKCPLFSEGSKASSNFLIFSYFFAILIPLFFLPFTFLFLAIAFFTLPEALSQKSLTEKKET